MTDKDKLSREDLRADRAAPPRRASTASPMLRGGMSVLLFPAADSAPS